jgi:hypothetical protein
VEGKGFVFTPALAGGTGTATPRNTGSRPCRLTGRPVVRFVGAPRAPRQRQVALPLQAVTFPTVLPPGLDAQRAGAAAGRRGERRLAQLVRSRRRALGQAPAAAARRARDAAGGRGQPRRRLQRGGPVRVAGRALDDRRAPVPARAGAGHGALDRRGGAGDHGSLSRRANGGTGGLTYIWDFGDGTIAVGGPRISRTYCGPIYADVKLLVLQGSKIGGYRQAMPVDGTTADPPATDSCGTLSPGCREDADGRDAGRQGEREGEGGAAMRSRTLRRAVVATVLPAALVGAALMGGGASVGGAQEVGSDHPVIDNGYMYSRLYKMSTSFIYRVSGADGPPEDPSSPFNLPRRSTARTSSTPTGSNR